MTRLQSFFYQEKTIYVFAIFISIFCSINLAHRAGVINPDAICYLLTAEKFGEASLPDVMHLCAQAKWPFYSILIYGFGTLTRLNFETAAYTLNAFFSLLSVIYFILIVKQLGGSKRILWLAALTILFSHQFNNVREYIIRDHGFWAFYLASVFFLLQYFMEPRWRTAFAWNVSLIIATLFRIEGALYLMFLPLSTFFLPVFSFAKKIKIFLMLYALTITLLFFLGAYLLAKPHLTLDQLGRLSELAQQFQQAFHLISKRYLEAKFNLSHHVLNPDSAKDAGLILILMILVWYVGSIIKNLSLGYFLLCFYSWQQNLLRWHLKHRLVIYGYLFLNILITSIFLLERFFLSKRYLIALSLILMLFVPFALDALIKKRSFLKHRALLITSSFLIIVTASTSVMNFYNSKFYMRAAGNWLANNIPAHALLYVNDYQVMYYSKHFRAHFFRQVDQYLADPAPENLDHYEYLAIRIHKNHIPQNYLSLTNFSQIKVFLNTRGDKVVIYKRNERNSYI